jgi:cytochrome c oxidase subunit 2
MRFPDISALAFSNPLSGNQSALNPTGPDAIRVAHLWLIILIIAIVVFVLVWIALLYGIARRPGGDADPATPILDTAASDRTSTRVVSVAAAVTVVTLFFVLISSVLAGRITSEPVGNQKHIAITVIGHQWWWEVQYPNTEADRTVITANEIHIPVGVPIEITTASRDVIHSFWVPNLTGKHDLIPGYNTAFWLRADRAGDYRGQCAEFCGMQHAEMGFHLIAESQAKFQAWENDQLRPGATPVTAQEQRGQQVFLRSECVMCHAIAGTIAGSHLGPDLTHLASRQTIAAGTVPNNIGNLAGWVIDPQHIKPGTLMPPNELSSGDMNDLLSYLQSLK